jgi:hypothetical protein
MTDTLPPWLWIPLAVVLWGYLTLDAIARRRRLRHAASNPAAMSLHGPEYRRAEDQEGKQAPQNNPQQHGSGPDQKHRRRDIHESDASR